MNVLFWMEPFHEYEKPGYLLPWARWYAGIDKTLSSAFDRYESVIVCSDTNSFITSGQYPIRHVELSVVEILKGVSGDFSWDAFREELSSEQVRYFAELVGRKLADFKPDVIVSGYRNQVLSALFPDAQWLCFEYSVFSRKPFPETWKFDPVGFGVGRVVDELEPKILLAHEYRPKRLDQLRERFDAGLRSVYERAGVARLDQYRRRFRKLWLFPAPGPILLSGQSVFGEVTRLLDVMPQDEALLVTLHPDAQALTLAQISYLQRRYRNFIAELNKEGIHAQSQYLLPFCDVVVGETSSLIVQAALWQKAVVGVGRNVLPWVYDARLHDGQLIGQVEGGREEKTVLLDWLMSRYSKPIDWILSPSRLGSFFEGVAGARSIDDYFDIYDEHAEADVLSVFIDQVGGFALASTDPMLLDEYSRSAQRFLKQSDSRSVAAEVSLEDWLQERLPTAVQGRLINEHLARHEGGPRFGIVLLDIEGDTSGVMQTVKSLGLDRGLYASLKIVVLSVAQVPRTSPEAKLHFISVKSNDYVDALNEVVRAGDFDWVMLVRAGEEFTPSGLMMTALELLDAQDCRAVYGDELQRNPEGGLGALFRPGFNLDMLLSFPTAMARHWLLRREVVLDVGGFDPVFSEALEFDLLLRVIEQGGMAGLGHVDEPILITAASVLAENSHERGALLAHLARRGYSGARLLPCPPGLHRIDYGHQQRPMVSIIIPTKDQLPVLQRCVESLLEKTAYTNYELLIVDNNSETVEAQAWFAGVEALADDKVKVLRYPHPFNYSAINNVAAREARGEYLVLLNNDTAIISENWLDELVNHALRPEVGIVGAKLLYPNGKIQHAGVVLGLRGPAEHPFIGEAMDSPGYMQRLQVDQNYSAVTAACLMIRASIYEQVGGLDEEHFKVSYNDVDLCLKVREAGYLIVWTPHAVVMHEGSVSQVRIDPQAAEAKRKRFAGEQDSMYEKWLPLLANDPAYNRNLSLNSKGFELEPDIGLTWRPLSWRPLPVVLAHPADPWGCGNYRIMQPFSALRQEGHIDGMLSEGLLQVVDLERYDPDVIVLQRQIGDARLEAMRRIKQFSRAFKVYELDDYLPNLPIKSVHREHMPKDVLKSLRRGVSFVDRFVVSTAPLAEAFAGLHPDIRVIENRLPVDWWKGLKSLRRRGRKPRVGWAGGVSHTGDLEVIADVVRELAVDVEWVFFGMCPEKIRPYVHEIHAGVHIDSYPQALARLDLDLALAPVEQNLFNECKSNLRLLEYGACGFPVICSDVRCYQGDGLPVTRVKNRFRDWVDAIRMHISDLDAAAQAGDRLRDAVYRDWMLEGENLERWHRAWMPD
ncbi:glycosyltransferase [Ectopseudomonas alcaliphila]|uniref:glycosyltransferase n=1 Tax=Ectopseudomonas alcaliphila TaxID=101564 RepID=UPI00277F0716|nr:MULTISPECIES: glycosyltransferase [Pseudomonas]MDP9941622.1 GT2 family glycosyltransferase [Pseudomonas sp. 3400]MDR7013841.1 GT2 family glycosyltransferase [Pseudomonas alcaliphila]